MQPAVFSFISLALQTMVMAGLMMPETGGLAEAQKRAVPQTKSKKVGEEDGGEISSVKYFFVEIYGNSSVNDEILKCHIGMKRQGKALGIWGSSLNTFTVIVSTKEDIDDFANRLTEYYGLLGFLEVKVTREFEFPNGTEYGQAKLHISEGKRADKWQDIENNGGYYHYSENQRSLQLRALPFHLPDVPMRGHFSNVSLDDLEWQCELRIAKAPIH
jgi:hypothetical protein